VRVEEVESAAGRTARCRQRGAADAENLVEQLSVTKLVALITSVDEIADEVGARSHTPLFDNDPDFLHGAIKSVPQFRRPRFARLDVGGSRNQVVERDEDRLAVLVHVHHGIQQGIDDQMRAVVLHAVKRGAVRLDAVEHAVDDPGNALFKLLDPPRRERWRQQAADTGMLLAVHLRDELREYDLVELLPAATARHLGLEVLGLGEHAMHVGVPADHHLRRALADHIERPPPRPFGHVPVRVRLERGAAEIDIDDVAAIEFRQ
jgi:hypothetical protein